MTSVASRSPARSPAPGKTLAGILGLLAAGLLLTHIPAEESGRKVEASIAPGGEIIVRHISGKQYLSAYLDIVRVATACDGITRDVRLGQSYTEAQCAAMLERELIIHAEEVIACTPGAGGVGGLARPGTDYQRVAAVSLAYNVGSGAYCRSTAAKRFNAGDYRGGCEAIGAWFMVIGRDGKPKRRNGFVFAGGRIVPGLVGRRTREKALCLKILPSNQALTGSGEIVP